MLITYPTDLPAFTATIRACASVALSLETHGPRKGDGLAWVSDWLAPLRCCRSAEKGVEIRVGKDLHQFKGRELDEIVLTMGDHANMSEHHRFQFTKRYGMARNVLGDFFESVGTANLRLNHLPAMGISGILGIS